VRAAGILIAGLGLALAARSAQLLAGRGRPRRGPQPAFVLAGPYVRMRNPLYAGLVVALAGASLAGGSAALGLITLVAAAGLHLWVVRVEERRLHTRFGEAYAEYVRRVPRWLPTLRRAER
jgi:protein-S-isoprenylcysteine O-methyltransferase Ste14